MDFFSFSILASSPATHMGFHRTELRIPLQRTLLSLLSTFPTPADVHTGLALRRFAYSPNSPISFAIYFRDFHILHIHLPPVKVSICTIIVLVHTRYHLSIPDSHYSYPPSRALSGFFFLPVYFSSHFLISSLASAYHGHNHPRML